MPQVEAVGGEADDGERALDGPLGSSCIPLEEMVKLDYLYTANWSVWSDLKLMLRTVPVVVNRRGL